MQTIQRTLIQTPWWVYVLLIYLLWMGIKATQPRIVVLRRLFIIPAFFIWFSLHTLLNTFTINILSISSWSIALILTTTLGVYQVVRLPFKVDKNKFLIELPGSWTTLILIVIIFATKYYFGYQMAVDPQISNQTSFELSMLIISGACTGLFFGRLIGYLYRFKVEPHIDLQTKPHERLFLLKYLR